MEGLTSDKSGCGCITEALGLGKCGQKCRKICKSSYPRMLVFPALDLYMSLRILLIASISVVFLYTSTAQDSLYRYDLPEVIYSLTHGAIYILLSRKPASWTIRLNSLQSGGT